MGNGPLRQWDGWHESSKDWKPWWQETPRRRPSDPQPPPVLTPYRPGMSPLGGPKPKRRDTTTRKKKPDSREPRSNGHPINSRTNPQVIPEQRIPGRSHAHSPSASSKGSVVSQAKPRSLVDLLLELRMKFSLHPNRLKKRLGVTFAVIEGWIKDPKSIDQNAERKIRQVSLEEQNLIT